MLLFVHCRRRDDRRCRSWASDQIGTLFPLRSTLCCTSGRFATHESTNSGLDALGGLGSLPRRPQGRLEGAGLPLPEAAVSVRCSVSGRGVRVIRVRGLERKNGHPCSICTCVCLLPAIIISSAPVPEYLYSSHRSRVQTPPYRPAFTFFHSPARIFFSSSAASVCVPGHLDIHTTNTPIAVVVIATA